MTKESERVDLVGMGTFCRLSGLSPIVVRGLEAAGVVKPLKADTGWRMFRLPQDLDAAQAHQREHKRRGGRRAD